MSPYPNIFFGCGPVCGPLQGRIQTCEDVKKKLRFLREERLSPHEVKPDGFVDHFFAKKWSGREESRFIFCKFFISIDLPAEICLLFVVRSVVQLLLLRLAKYSALSAKVKWY